MLYYIFLVGLIIIFSLGLLAVLFFNSILLIGIHDMRTGALIANVQTISSVLLLNIIPATYPILYGMGLRLTFLKLKQENKPHAIGCQFLPLISVGLFLIAFMIINLVGTVQSWFR